ncbi:hypothetical protein BDQ17DRAFT_1343868 [Cyathus striatus]|nr:hypothetical protein BDQ17DRAFT_1343868 [Cyathus striatus]
MPAPAPAPAPAHDSPPRIYSSPRPLRSHHDPSFAHVLYDNNARRQPSFNPSPSSSAMYSFVAQSSSRQSPQVHLFPANPYPTPPPPIAHKVWILDCKSCGTFLTNRGMKAVLLLRPNVSLYSSDALPVNCSAYAYSPEHIRSKSFRRPAPSASHSRTCECLTQTLYCHGCGSTVGYMIVIPCARCTTSVSASNRATNGHRFVFHATEVSGTERHYVADESGIIPYEPTSIVLSRSPIIVPSQNHIPTHYFSQRDTYSRQQQRQGTTGPTTPSEYFPTPPLEFANPTLASSFSPPEALTPDENLLRNVLPIARQVDYLHTSSPSPSLPNTYPNEDNLASTSGSRSSGAMSNPSSEAPIELKEQPAQRLLKPGGVLFWHHLATSGEIPGVMDDERARLSDAIQVNDASGCFIPKPMSFDR